MKNYLPILLSLIVNSVLANTYYVSISGSDDNPGILTRPFRTVQKGANNIKAGDTVFVRAGTYASLLYLSTAGTEANPAAFLNYPGERPILDGEYNKPSGNMVRLTAFLGILRTAIR